MSEIDNISPQKQDILSIRLSTDGFSFIITNGEEGNIIRKEEWKVKPASSMTANFKMFCQEYSLKEGHYKKVRCVVDTDRFTLMPLEMFDEDDVENILYTTFERQRNEEVNFVVANAANVVLVYAQEASLMSLLKEAFDKVEILPSFYILFEEAYKRFAKKGEVNFFAKISNKQVYAFVFQGENVGLANAYKSSDVENILYILMCIWRKLELNQTEDKLLLSGDARGINQLQAKVGSFIKNVERVSIDKEMM